MMFPDGIQMSHDGQMVFPDGLAHGGFHYPPWLFQGYPFPYPPYGHAHDASPPLPVGYPRNPAETDNSQSKPPQKKKRVVFSETQNRALIHRFNQNSRILKDEREGFARYGLTQEQVKVWFQNRRYKLKKQKKTSGDEAVDDVYGGEYLGLDESTYGGSANESSSSNDQSFGQSEGPSSHNGSPAYPLPYSLQYPQYYEDFYKQRSHYYQNLQQHLFMGEYPQDVALYPAPQPKEEQEVPEE